LLPHWENARTTRETPREASQMMATRTQDLLDRYLEALDRSDPLDEGVEDLAPGCDVRTCANCGAHTLFRIDAEGDWAECTACGHLA
jgi:hypothetical protein